MSQYGEVYEYGYGQGRENPPTSVLFKKAIQRQLLYQMSPSEVNFSNLIFLQNLLYSQTLIYGVFRSFYKEN